MQKATLLTAILALTIGCAGAGSEAPAPAISTSAADNLIPGQLARGAALQTEIRSAGHDCNKVVRTFQQGVRDGQDVWDAECEGGESFGVISKADGTTDVLECGAVERQRERRAGRKFESRSARAKGRNRSGLPASHGRTALLALSPRISAPALDTIFGTPVTLYWRDRS